MPVLSTISRETDDNGFMRSETFKTERGFQLTIKPTAGGLYEIIPESGGKAPTICDGAFTSYLQARKAVIAYVEENEKFGYAEHPDRPKKEVKSVKRIDE
jgi:hypothetical protein